LAIDTLAPQGVENACEGAVKGASRRSAAYAAQSLAWLAAQPYVRADRLAAIGFSMGAIAVLDLVDPFVPHAPPPGLRAAVAYYPACRSRDGLVTAPLLILDGSDDDWTPAPPCAAMAQSGVAAGKPIEITTYPGATHSFNTPRNAATTYLGHTLRYDAAASDDAWSKTKKFLARYLAP
jgi:dienelactone hydrolase